MKKGKEILKDRSIVLFVAIIIFTVINVALCIIMHLFVVLAMGGSLNKDAFLGLFSFDNFLVLGVIVLMWLGFIKRNILIIIIPIIIIYSIILFGLIFMSLTLGLPVSFKDAFIGIFLLFFPGVLIGIGCIMQKKINSRRRIRK